MTHLLITHLISLVAYVAVCLRCRACDLLPDSATACLSCGRSGPYVRASRIAYQI